MKLGIIVCGLVDPSMKAEFGEYADMIVTTLSPHGDFDFQQFSALEQALPEDLDSCDGYIITGSIHDAYADEPWINDLADWIRRCDAVQKPLVGICFGHQIISIALGGKVEKSDKGWGIGMSYNQLLLDAPWMNPKLEQLDILVSHQDQVVALPAGVEVLAASDFCPNYMLAKDQHIMTIQGHPEFSVAFERSIVAKKKSLISDAHYQQAMASLEQTPDSASVMNWFANFFRQHAA